MDIKKCNEYEVKTKLGEPSCFIPHTSLSNVNVEPRRKKQNVDQNALNDWTIDDASLKEFMESQPSLTYQLQEESVQSPESPSCSFLPSAQEPVSPVQEHLDQSTSPIHSQISPFDFAARYEQFEKEVDEEFQFE